MIYQGYEVLQEEPNGIDSWREMWVHSVYDLTSPTGVFRNREKSTWPIVDRPFEWFMASRTEINAFKAWLLSKKGRYTPFWVPTWRWDMTVLGQPAADELEIANVEYAVNQFPDNARRHLAIIQIDGTLAARNVTAAVVTSPQVETLTLDAAVGQVFAVCFLVLCRLADDEITLEWHGQELATASLRLVEIPSEAP